MAISKATRNTYLVCAVLLAGAVVVLATLLSDRAFRRLDLTAEGRYSLSPPFLKILNGMEDKVKLTYYVAGPAGTWFDQLKRNILDQLGEIKTAGRGKVELEIVDPLIDKEARKKLKEQGLEFQVPSTEKDKLTVSTVFTSLEVTYADKPSILIPVIQRPEDIEYELASRLVELNQKQKPIVAIHSPRPDAQMAMAMRQQPQSDFDWVEKLLTSARRFDVRRVDLTAGNGIPDNTALLVLIRPEKLGERAQFEVAKYLAEGGHVFLLESPWKVALEFGWRVQKTPSGLEEYLQGFGLDWGPDFLCDESSVRLTQINRLTGQVSQLALPFFIQVNPQNVNQDYFITRLLPQLVMPFPAALAVDEAKAEAAGVKAEVLASTSSLTWTSPYADTFDPEAAMENKARAYVGAQPVFVKFQGQFPFPWAGKPIPPWDKKEGEEEKPDEKKETGPAAVTKKEGLLLAWSCPDSFSDTYRQGDTAALFRGNESALVNIAEACSSGPDLIELRQKRYETRVIEKLEGKDAERNWFKASLIGALPLAVVLFALSRWWLRRSSQLRYERRFAATTGPSSFTP